MGAYSLLSHSLFLFKTSLIAEIPFTQFRSTTMPSPVAYPTRADCDTRNILFFQ